MRRIVLSLLCLAAGNNAARAAFWQSPQWAVSATVETTVGYDSNLTTSRNGPEDGFASTETQLMLKRWNSATRLELTGNLIGTTFQNGRADDQLDGGVRVFYAYPVVEDVDPRYSGFASWRKVTFPSSLLGERLITHELRSGLSSRLYAGAKYGIDGEIGYDQYDYTTASLNRNDSITGTLGLAYEATPRLELSLNSVSSYGVSKPHPAGRAKTNSWQEGLTFRVKGDLGAKWTSSAYFGGASVRYRGAYQGSDFLPIAGGGLTFEATPRRTFDCSLDFGSDFSPEGEAMQKQSLTLSISQRIFSNWRMSARISPTRVVRHRSHEADLKDNAVIIGTSVAYAVSNKWSAALAYEFTRQSSNRSELSFTRHYVSLGAVYKF